MHLIHSMRNQLLFLARLGCYRHPTFEFSLISHCLLPNRNSAPPLSLPANYISIKAVAPSHAQGPFRSHTTLQTKSTSHQKLRHPFTFSGLEFVDLRQKSRRSNTHYLTHWTERFDLGRTFSTAPTEASEKAVEEEEVLKRRPGSMAEGGSLSHREKDGEILYPAVDTYGPVTIRGSDLEPGKKKKWCTCGLSKKAPWCDGAHKKTGFRSLKWEVPEKPQSIYQICNCKYTKTPPFCDGTHTNLPAEVLERQKNCPNKPNHEECLKMCTGCGWKVDF